LKVYFISGLGANKRAFSFLDLSFCEPVFIDWLKPNQAETLPEYAKRLRACIQEESPIIVGVSFGGMLATEMAKKDSKIRAIIISSNKSSTEFPNYLRIWKHFPVYKWVPRKVVKFTGRITQRLVGPRGVEQRKIFAQILEETDHSFTVWAINAILHWSNSVIPSNVIHIHGSSDTLLPNRYVKADYIIKGGKHIMIMDHAEEISILLEKLIVDKKL
jgi:pimeloyl-ACP methyl ester carboxylesterase